MYLKELGDRFDTAIKQFVPSLTLTDTNKIQMIFDAENFLQEETEYLIYEDVVTVPAMTVLTPVPISFRWRHIYSAWDMVHGLEYERRDYDQFVYSINNWRGTVPVIDTPWRTLPGGNIRDHYPQGDPANFIFTVENHNLYVYPFPVTDVRLTVRYDPIIPVLAEDDPYFAAWFASDAAMQQHYATVSIYREFIPYWEAVMEYMIWHYLEGFTESKACQNRAMLGYTRLYDPKRGYIARMMKNRRTMDRMTQIQYHGFG